MNESQSKLIITQGKDAFPLSPQKEAMSLDVARENLNKIVNTHENSIMDSSQIEKFGGLSADEIRESLETVVESLMSEHKAEKMFGTDARELKKIYPEDRSYAHGSVWLQIEPQLKWDTEGKKQCGSKGGSVSLDVFFDDKGQTRPDPYGFPTPVHQHIEYAFNLVAEPDKYQDVMAHFRDSRTEKSISADELKAQVPSQGKVNLDDYKFWIRGLRWMAKNLLEWDKVGVIMPEKLDSPSLPMTAGGTIPQLPGKI